MPMCFGTTMVVALLCLCHLAGLLPLTLCCVASLSSPMIAAVVSSHNPPGTPPHFQHVMSNLLSPLGISAHAAHVARSSAAETVSGHQTCLLVHEYPYYTDTSTKCQRG